MDMNKTFFQRKEDREPQWHVIDGKGEVLGRLATRIADLLVGKKKTTYTPHTDGGDYVVLINVQDVELSGNKMENKIYTRVSGWMGGKKEIKAKDMVAKDPKSLIYHAVKGMIDQNRHRDERLRRFKIYVGSEHPHIGQVQGAQQV